MRHAGPKGAGHWIWGLHSVEAAIECCPQLILEIQLDREARDPVRDRVEELARNAGLKVSVVPRLPRLAEDARPQGICARLKGFPVESAPDYLEEIAEESGQWILLDRIQDPRNFGAILRSAAAFGVKGAFFANREQAPLTGTVAVASAGQMFRMRLIEVPNLVPICRSFEDSGAAIFSLEMGGRDLEEALSSSGASRFVWIVGSEGKGVRPGLSGKAMTPVSIQMSPAVESLNASVAASLAFYRTFKRLQA